MSSVFRARDAADAGTGSGGKIARRRRDAAAAAHPYSRSEPPRRSETGGWISGFLAPARKITTGAGKLLSFAFGSLRDDDSSSSGSDDDEVDDYSDSDSIHSRENGRTPAPIVVQPVDTQPSAQKSGSKHTIERLLLQETFTRDECTELMKIIQSRVVDIPTMKEGEGGTQKELYYRTFGNDSAFPGAWRSFSQSGNSPGAYPYSLNGLNTLSPGSALREPNLCDTAIMEAKKWLEEKKLEPCSNSERDHGNCDLSTHVLPHATEGDAASPVDMAKSYMRSRPPWASPSWNNIEFKTPPPTGIRHYTDESLHSMACCSLPSTKELKRSSPSLGSWGTIEETRRVRLKSMDDMADHPVHDQNDSSTTIFTNRPTKTLLASDNEVLCITHDSSSSPAANLNLPAEAAAGKSCQDGGLHSSNEKDVEVNLFATNHVKDSMDNMTSIRNVSDLEELMDAEFPRNDISFSTNLPTETKNSGHEKGTSASHPIILERSEGLEDTQMTKELVSGDSAPCEYPVPDSISVQHEGQEMLNSELEVMASKRDNTVLPFDVDGVANHDHLCASSPQSTYQEGNTVQAENSLQLHKSAGLEGANSLLSSPSQGEDQKEANGLPCSDEANGFLSSKTSLSETWNAEPLLKPPDEVAQNSSSSDHGEVPTEKSMGTCELSSEVSIEVPVTNEANTFTDELQNISKTMDKEPLIRTQKKLSATRGGMRGKKVAYSRKGRGRGKGK